ncbi:hypothetical protein [Brevibacillus laterosporus]|uniref:hypothetical protein n=1 Tax=Brevibacillus laterosporus TaxID=1465 RepID=UPI0026557CEB|nr:hypothetical protein [Brevibacillus laterosporus]MDN9012447.1 hypothetical protein [Brevibacillus laterosporus]MDO0943490.1 hypothetical protein [Brevibacillus laterosporus]
MAAYYKFYDKEPYKGPVIYGLPVHRVPDGWTESIGAPTPVDPDGFFSFPNHF